MSGKATRTSARGESKSRSPLHLPRSLKLDFVKPFETHNIVDFTLEPKGDSTNVTWDMHGPSPYISKIIGIFINMDRMIGNDFETGLANLKTVAEKQATDGTA